MTSSADSGSSTVLVNYEPHASIATLTLNRPQQYNALSATMLTELRSALQYIAEQKQLTVVILAAAGKAFCAGHDLKEIRSSEDQAVHRELFERGNEVMLTIATMPQVVIARVQGLATAAGCQLVAQCDLAIACSQASFAVSGINAGLFCSTPAVPLSRNLPAKQALQMLLTGDFIDARTAYEQGLINRVTSAEELNQVTQELAEKIASKSPLSTRIGKRMFYQQREMTLADAYTYAADTMAGNLNSEDAREGIDAFIEKRKPHWRGC